MLGPKPSNIVKTSGPGKMMYGVDKDGKKVYKGMAVCIPIHVLSYLLTDQKRVVEQPASQRLQRGEDKKISEPSKEANRAANIYKNQRVKGRVEDVGSRMPIKNLNEKIRGVYETSTTGPTRKSDLPKQTGKIQAKRKSEDILQKGDDKRPKVYSLMVTRI